MEDVPSPTTDLHDVEILLRKLVQKLVIELFVRRLLIRWMPPVERDHVKFLGGG